MVLHLGDIGHRTIVTTVLGSDRDPASRKQSRNGGGYSGAFCLSPSITSLQSGVSYLFRHWAAPKTATVKAT